MKPFPLLAVAAVATAFAFQACAHRTSGLHQASLVEILPSQVGVEVTLLPGIDIAPQVVATLDANGDGEFSETESRNWAATFLAGQSVTVDGTPLPLKLGGVRTCPLPEMSDGHAEIVIHFSAALGSLARGRHTLVCANHYEPIPSGYQSNGLVPRSPGVRIRSHHGDERQQALTLDVEFSEGGIQGERNGTPLSGVRPSLESSRVPVWISGAGIALAALAAGTTRFRRNALPGS